MIKTPKKQDKGSVDSRKSKQKSLNQTSSFSKIRGQTKYSLNKPRLINQFKDSMLFQKCNTANNIKNYTQRYTYNERTRSFERQNLNIIQTQYKIDYNYVQMFNKQNLIARVKLLKIEKKPQNLHQLTTSNKMQQPTIDNNNKRQVKLNCLKQEKDELPFSKQSKISSLRRLRTLNKQFQRNFSNNNQKQTLRQYIKTNNKEPLISGLNSLKQGCKIHQNVKKVKKSFRNLKFKQIQSTAFQSDIKPIRFQQEEFDYQLIEKQREKQRYFRSLDQQIDKLYDILSQLKNLGYTKEKINQWVWGYCENNKKFMHKILFKTQGYRSILAQGKNMCKLEQIQITKANIRKFKRTINSQQMYLHVQDISYLCSCLQQNLNTKQYFELRRLQNKIQETSYQIRNNYLGMKDQKADEILNLISTFQQKKKLKPIQYFEMLKFYEDVKRLQAHFGKVKGLNISSKKTCQNLTDVQLQILRKNKRRQVYNQFQPSQLKGQQSS